MEEAIRRVKEWKNGVLDLSGLGLNELPELPLTLKEFYCYDDQLTTLPELPSGLIYKDYSNNPLPIREEGETEKDWISRMNQMSSCQKRCSIIRDELRSEVSLRMIYS